jgi:hypothetical protein
VVRAELQLEVDQSRRIEEPQDTVLAFSNQRQYAILIPSAIKRRALAHLRRLDKSTKLAVLLIFAAALFLLLRDVADQLALVVIDEEYPGHEAMLKGRLLQLLRGTTGLWIPKEVVTFGRVGKKSGAHRRAIAISRGREEPDRRVTLDELLEALSLA